MKYWKLSFYGLGILPLGFIISLLAFYFEAARILGHLPRYNQPDPKELAIYLDFSPIIDFTAYIWIISLGFWFLLTTVYLIVKRKHITWKPLLYSVVGQVAAIGLFLSGIVEWYAD